MEEKDYLECRTSNGTDEEHRLDFGEQDFSLRNKEFLWQAQINTVKIFLNWVLLPPGLTLNTPSGLLQYTETFLNASRQKNARVIEGFWRSPSSCPRRFCVFSEPVPGPAKPWSRKQQTWLRSGTSCHLRERETRFRTPHPQSSTLIIITFIISFILQGECTWITPWKGDLGL